MLLDLVISVVVLLMVKQLIVVVTNRGGAQPLEMLVILLNSVIPMIVDLQIIMVLVIVMVCGH